LHFACEEHQTKYAELLLKIEPEKQVLCQDHKGKIPLHQACCEEIARLLLQYHPSKQVLQECWGNLPLHSALIGDHHGVVACLLEHDPIPQLSKYTYCEMKYIHVANPSPEAPDYRHMLPIHMACQSLERLESLPLILSIMPERMVIQELKRIPLHFVCTLNAHESAQLLLEQQADEQVLHEDDEMMLPLHRAVRHGAVDCIKLLLQHQPEAQLKKLQLGDRYCLMSSVFNCFVDLFVDQVLEEKYLDLITEGSYPRPFREAIMERVQARQTKSARSPGSQ